MVPPFLIRQPRGVIRFIPVLTFFGGLFPTIEHIQQFQFLWQFQHGTAAVSRLPAAPNRSCDRTGCFWSDGCDRSRRPIEAQSSFHWGGRRKAMADHTILQQKNCWTLKISKDICSYWGLISMIYIYIKIYIVIYSVFIYPCRYD